MTRLSLLARAAALAALAALGTAAPVRAQTSGAIAGRITDRTTGVAIAEVAVTVDDGVRGDVSDTAGRYRAREVRSGWHRLRAQRIGYRPFVAESVLVSAGQTTTFNFALTPVAVTLDSLVVEARVDPVLDPLATRTEQTYTAEEIRRLPISSVQEAIALSAGAVEGSYRGGRLGQESFILDGLGVKNQLDASTGELGLRLPTDILTEASLVTNGFSARYGQAVSGMINVVTRDGDDRWGGGVRYETDRPFSGAGDLGLDRVVLAADGPLPAGIRVVGVLDATARLDADPVNAPPPPDPRDPRAEQDWMLPHNAGEQYDLAGKAFLPIGLRHSIRLLGLRSTAQRLLFDQLYKYDSDLAAGQRLTGTLLTGHYQYAAAPTAGLPLVADVRIAWFDREFSRGELEETPGGQFGAFTGEKYRIVGEDLARRQDTVAARDPLPGYQAPTFSDRTEWGVPAFFLGTGSRGDLGWSRFNEFRTQVDVALGTGRSTDLYVGGEVVDQRVRTFSRIQGWAPVGDTVPPATASDFSPLSVAAYAEAQVRVADLALTAGLRYDQFDPGADLPGTQLGARRRLNPRFGVSTVLRGATFVASYGRFSQAPDFQFLVDGSFDDTTRTGRYRRGNPDLGFEDSHQFEFSLRTRPGPALALRVNAYYKWLDGMVSTTPLGVDPDSSIFGNGDYGNVRGGEVIFEREFHEGFGARVAYTLQYATASSSSAYVTTRLPEIDPASGDTIFPAKVDFPLDFDQRHTLVAMVQGQTPVTFGPLVAGGRPFAGLEGAAIFRYGSGLPYSRTDASGDSLVGPPNDSRLPATHSLDVLLRRPFTLGRARASIYLDVRNLLNRENVVAVRRDTGTPNLTEDRLAEEAERAYQANPGPIPYESARYRPWADADGNGVLQGRDELYPLYLSAARDYFQPLFAYGPPRLLRLGVEVGF
ncbi:MAG TPA: TonB-dependent receptor [Gemmatimonadales bacterium]|nr:TonB-dependent receptor [Gemmatimonadales bacterium]